MFTVTRSSLATFIVPVHHSPVLFFAFLPDSILISLSLLIAQSALRYRRHGDPHLFAGNQKHPLFRDELISSPRHVEFADSILEVDDRDWRAD